MLMVSTHPPCTKERSMTSIPDLVPALQTLLTTTADQAGRDSGLIRRVRVLTGARFVQTLVFGWLGTPDATLNCLAQTAAALGVQITGQGIADRFAPQSADCLARVLAAAIEQAITADPTDLAVLNRVAGVVVIDGSVIGLPAERAVQSPGGANQMSGQAALKLGVGIDLVTGRLDGPHLRAARPHDRLLPIQDQPIVPNALRLADLGFFDLAVLAALTAQQAYWLTRVPIGTVVLDPVGQRLDLVTLMRQRCKRTLDLPILLGLRERLPCRLLAERVPRAVADERRQRLRDEGRRRGQTVSERGLAPAAWTIRVTKVPARAVNGCRGDGRRTSALADRTLVQTVEERWDDRRMAQQRSVAHPHRTLRQTAGDGDPALDPGRDQLAVSRAEYGQGGADGAGARLLPRLCLPQRRPSDSGAGEHRALLGGGGTGEQTAETTEHLPTLAGGGNMNPYLDAYGAVRAPPSENRSQPITIAERRRL
jgi:hypothetical protein